MKKLTVLIFALLCANVLWAELEFSPPTKELEWFGGENDLYSSSEEAERQTGIRGSQRAPIAPATLLLIWLGTTAVGTTIIRNLKNKKRDKKWKN